MNLIVRLKKPCISLVLAFFVASIVGCFHSKNKSQTETETNEVFRLSINGQEQHSFKVKNIPMTAITVESLDLPEPLLAASYGASTIDDYQKDLLVLVFARELFDGEYQEAFYLLLETDQEGNFREEIVEALYLNRATGQYYKAWSKSESSQKEISIAKFGNVGASVEGSFDLKLCSITAIEYRKCANEDNLTHLTGEFSVIRESDQLVVAEGSIEQPKELQRTLTEKYLLNVEKDKPSFYRAGIRSSKKIYIAPYDFRDEVQLAIYSDASFSNLLCETSLIENPSKSSLSNLYLDNACFIDSEEAISEIYIKANIAEESLSRLKFELDVIDFTERAYEGSSQERVDIGDASLESVSFSGSVGGLTYSNSKLSSSRKSYYQAKVTTETTYELIFNYASATDFQVEVRDGNSIICRTWVASEARCIFLSTSELINVDIVVPFVLDNFGIEFEFELARSEQEFFSSEGTSNEPVALNFDNENSVYSGSASYGSSYYYLDVEEDSPITINYLPKKAGVSLRLADGNEPFYNPSICNLDYENRSCTVSSVDGDNKIYLRASTLKYSGGSFEFSTEQGGVEFNREGVESALELNSTDNMELSGDGFQVDRETSTYKIFVNPDQIYTLTLSNLSHKNIDFDVRNSFSRICRGEFETISSKSCSFIAQEDYVLVEVYGSSTSSGGTYEFALIEGGVVFDWESISDFILLDDDLPFVEKNRHVGRGSSTYGVEVVAGKSYRVTLSDISNYGVSMHLFEDFYRSVGECSEEGDYDIKLICEVVVPDEVENLVINVSGYSTASGASYTIKVEEI